MNDNTTTSADISDRIADVLAGDASVDEIAAVISLGECERDRLQAQREEARVVAFDPLVKGDAVEAARRVGSAADWALARLNVALDQLHSSTKPPAVRRSRGHVLLSRRGYGRARRARGGAAPHAQTVARHSS